MDPWNRQVTLEELTGHDIWQLRRQFLDRTFPCVGGWEVLELGSGPGHDSLVFAQRGARVIALDYSATGLDCARRIYDSLQLPVRTVCADARCTGLPDASFDLVFNAGVLEHFSDEDLEKVLDEMIRLTKPGGTVLAFCPNRYNIFYQHMLRHAPARQYEYERAYTAAEMKKSFVARGLPIIHASGVHVHPAINYFLPAWLPKHHRIEPAMRWCFAWLERMSRLGNLKSLIGQDFVVWGVKPHVLGPRIPLAGSSGGPCVKGGEQG